MGFLSDVWSGIKDVGSKVADGIGDFYKGVGDYILEYSGAAAPIVGAIAGGPLGSAIGTGIGALGSQHNAKKQLQSEQSFNAEQAQLNREFQVQMWNATNEYNSVASQLQRIAQAGINPNLAFDSGYKSATASAPSGSQAAASPSIAGQMLLFNATLEQMRAQTDNINSNTALNKQTFDWNDATQDARYEGLMNMNAKTRAEVDKLISDRKIQEDTFMLFSEMNDEKLKIVKQELVNLRNQNMQIIENINKTRQETANLKKTGELIDAQVDKTYTDIYATDMSSLDTSITAQYNALKLQHSQTMGMPAGTPAQEALFNLWLQGKDIEYMGLLRSGADLEYGKSSFGNFNTYLRHAYGKYQPYTPYTVPQPKPLYMPGSLGKFW